MSPTRTSVHRHRGGTSATEHLTVMADLFGMLADPGRLRILMHLRTCDEACVSDIAEAAAMSESAVSHALRLLRAHGFVETRREGRWIFYALVDEHVRVLLDATAEHFEQRHRAIRR